MPKLVVSKSAESNKVETYYVSRLAGPRIGKRRVAKGEAVEMSEHEARALVASGALVTDKALVDDPFGEAAAAEAAEKAAGEEAARAAVEQQAAQAKAAADAAAEAARQAAAKAEHPAEDHPAPTDHPAAEPAATDAAAAHAGA